jgi:VanZ family protein
MPISSSRPILFALAAVILGLLLLVLGATPMAVGLFTPPWDKAVHFVVYLTIGCLFALGFGRRRPLLCIVLTVALGALDESLQFFEPGRMPELADWIADAAGACGSVLIASRVPFAADAS